MTFFSTVSSLQPWHIFHITLLTSPPPRLLRQRSLRDTEKLQLRALCAANMDVRVLGREGRRVRPEPVFVNVYGAQESIPRNRFR
jgi:hypothetical protein